jgi:LPXTG-site transpeptidase (sortase) family protein
MDMVAKPTVSKSPALAKPKPEPTPEPKPKSVEPIMPAIPTSPAIPLDDLLNDFVEEKPGPRNIAKAKKEPSQLARKLAARKQAKAEKTAARQAAKISKPPKPAKPAKVKTPKTPKPPKLHAKKDFSARITNGPKSDFATHALAAAANSTSAVAQNPTSLVMDGGDTAAVAESENVLDKINGLPKVSFELKINKRHVLAFVRTIIIVSILAVSGYLAWDTWLTNKTVQETFSNPAAAVAIDEAGPADVDTTSLSNQAWAAYTVPADQARYIFLPTINTQARVLSVGVNSKGKIDAPKNANDAAWYDGSAKPGQEGQVFINGHTSFTPAYKAAFDNLPKLQVGDQIIIERGDGKQISYRVVNSETVSASKVDMKKVLNVPNGGSKGLTLMSCTGKFNYRTQSSDTRVIVYAVQE